MWARYLEMSLGLWLAVSPAVLSHRGVPEWGGPHDVVLGLAIVVIAALTHVEKLRRLHLLLLPVAVWLTGAGWWLARAADGIPAVYQSWILVGLCLFMFAVLPSRASTPPPGWEHTLRAEER
jgi:hypothetical protein